MAKDKIIHADLSYYINGIIFEVHNNLGNYCNEKQYGDAIEEMLKKEGINYEREKILPKTFEGESKNRCIADFVIEDKIVLEIKAKRFIINEDYYQLLRYLRSLGFKLGILVNFRDKFIKPKRVINSLA